MTALCVGWDDGRPCPYWAGDWHGCRDDDGHMGPHRCLCGAEDQPVRTRQARKQRRHTLPFAALEQYVYSRHGPDPQINHAKCGVARLVTDGFIGRHCGVNPQTVGIWRRRGHLGTYQPTGEKAAEALGVRVETIWPLTEERAA